MLYRAYNRFSQGRDLLDGLGVAWKLGLALPFVGAALGYTTSGWLGAVIVGLILSGLLVVTLVLATVIAVGRLPINIEVIPNPVTVNNVTSTATVQMEGHAKSRINHATFWSHLKVNNYGREDHRITGLLAEFRKPIWGIYPKTVAIVRCRYQETDKDQIDWFLPKAGLPVERIADFVSMESISDEKLTPGDEGLSVRIVAEIGSRQRRVYVSYDGHVDVRGPYV